MLEQDPKAGTDAEQQPVSDDAEKGGESQAADSDKSGDEQETVKISKREYLTHKQKAEEFNRLQQEKAALEERLRQQEGSAMERPQMTRADQELRELEQEYAEVQERARPYTGSDGRTYAGDPVAKTTLRLIADRINEKRETRDELWLLSATTVGDDGEERSLTAKERKEAREFYHKNREHFQSLPAAWDALEGQRSRAARVELARKKREAEEVIEDRERRDVVTTHTRDVTAREAKERRMTHTAFDNKVKELEEAGKYEEAWKLRKEALAQKVILSG